MHGYSSKTNLKVGKSGFILGKINERNPYGGKEAGCHQIPPKNVAFLYYCVFKFPIRPGIICCTTLSMINKCTTSVHCNYW